MDEPALQPAEDQKEEEEVVKRLTPTSEVLRELFLKSGNLCAFPGCNKPIMDQEGRFVAQLCHIEAAEAGGERFNKKMRNEERRAYSNLVLLCYEHHIVTNGVEKWTVDRMRALKASHEKKVFEFIENLRLRVVDFTSMTPVKPAVSLGRLANLLEWNLDPPELVESAAELNRLLSRLRKLPPPARELLSVIISKVTRSGFDRNHVSWHEIRLSCGLDHETLSELGQLLDKYAFICDAGPDDYGHSQTHLYDLGCGWRVWDDLRAFSDAGLGTLHELIVDLNFSLLD